MRRSGYCFRETNCDVRSHYFSTLQDAQRAGSVKTEEGFTQYEPGDSIVSNNSDGSDEYAMKAQKFEALYTPDNSEP
jgi:hypothetical protein